MSDVMVRFVGLVVSCIVLVLCGCGSRGIQRLPRDGGLDVSWELEEEGRDAGSQVSRDTSSVVRRYAAFPLLSRLLSPTTCHGRTLNLPVEMHASGLQAFHLCYVTPDSRTRTDGGLVSARPASVDFQVGSGTFVALFSGVTVEAPRVADPWTASVAIAVSTSVAVPRFNVRHLFSTVSAQAVWALDGDGRAGVIERGSLRLWRVAADGSQTEVPLQLLFMSCGGASVGANLPRASYVAQGQCPAMLQMCHAGPYHCRH